MLSLLRQSLFAVVVVLAATANAAAGAIGAAPISRVAFQAVLAGQLRQYMSLAPVAGLGRLETLSVLSSRRFPALAVDRAAASAALALIVSPQAAQLREDRETRVMLARVLGKENISLIAAAAGELQARAAGDPALSVAVALKMYENLGGDGWARGVLAGIQQPLVILISPLKRARQTAAALQELLDQRGRSLAKGPPRRLYEAHVERGLAELAFGEFEGWTLEKAETLASWPAFNGISGAGRTFLDRFPKGESRFDVMIRQRGVLRRMVKDYPGRQIVTFAHFETVVAQKAVLGLIDRTPADGALRVTPVANAQPIRLAFPGARISTK